jgi:hypothetical protein
MFKYIYIYAFKWLNFFFKLKNFRKPKILIYTDSRGFNVIGRYGKSPWESYIKKLCFNYRVDYYICPENHTTIIDFLRLSKDLEFSNYDAIILHCGVVDFSPRPLSNIKVIKDSKVNDEFKLLFEANSEYYKAPFETVYKNEKTITIYSIEYFVIEVIPILKEIKNLIWINSNSFVKGWEGNYTKGRPSNIDSTVSQFDMLLCKSLENVIDIRSWSNNEIMKYTIDNIHFTKEGFNVIYKLIRVKLNDILKHG